MEHLVLKLGGSGSQPGWEESGSQQKTTSANHRAYLIPAEQHCAIYWFCAHSTEQLYTRHNSLGATVSQHLGKCYFAERPLQLVLVECRARVEPEKTTFTTLMNLLAECFKKKLELRWHSDRRTDTNWEREFTSKLEIRTGHTASSSVCLHLLGLWSCCDLDLWPFDIQKLEMFILEPKWINAESLVKFSPVIFQILH